MNICFYINKLGDGGAERVVANLANHLSRDHTITVINSFKYFDEYPLVEGVKHIYIDNDSYKTRLGRNIARIRFLRKFLKKERPDAAISFMAEPNFRLIVASVGLHIKTIISVRNDPKQEYKGIVGKFIGEHILPRANGCVFQTKEAQSWFTTKIIKKSTIIFNPVEDKFFRSLPSGERKNIVTVGRLSKQKNHRILIKAFSMISESVDDDLVIYGQGDLKNELLLYAESCGVGKRVLFPGQISDVASSVKNAKLFVLSSDYEGMPNALMEAMALGVPCISTDCPCGGPRELLGEFKDCQILVPVGNEDALSKCMFNLLTNDELLYCNSEYVKTKSQQFYYKNIYFEWEKYIQSIIEGD